MIPGPAYLDADHVTRVPWRLPDEDISLTRPSIGKTRLDAAVSVSLAEGYARPFRRWNVGQVQINKSDGRAHNRL